MPKSEPTRKVSVGVVENWLDRINNLTVADAIQYLSSLPKDHHLSFALSGDTHGVELDSCLYYYRPETSTEWVDRRKAFIKKELVVYESGLRRHTDRGIKVGIDRCERKIADLSQKLLLLETHEP